MVQAIYDFLVLFIGDIALNNSATLTLMNLVSYIITLGIFSFILFPIISLFKSIKKEGK